MPSTKTTARSARNRRTGPMPAHSSGALQSAAAAVAGPPASHSADGDGQRGLRILSSAHLADAPAGELSELEFGLIVANHAFTRWITRCMAAAGMPELGPTDILVLHHVHHRDRPKKLADICFTLNYEDTHVVSYALKKLVGLGLLAGDRQGKEVHYSVTADGRALVGRYRSVRALCLLPTVTGDLGDTRTLADTARLLRTISGLYDQAARAAASL